MIEQLGRRGLFGAPLLQDEPRAPAEQPRRLSTGRIVAGAIGDALAQWGGGKPVFAQAMQAERERGQEVADEQRRVATQFALWEAQRRYEAANPKPQEPTALERNYGFLNGQEPGLGATYARNFANNGGGAPALMNVPGVGIVSVPRNGAQGGAPTAPVGRLTPMTGGPTPSASGGFR